MAIYASNQKKFEQYWFLFTYFFNLQWRNTVLPHKQDVHAGHLCTLCILCAYLQSAHLQIMVFKLNAIKKIK